MPCGQQLELFASARFLVGLAYCTYPLNLLVYLMNDIADIEVDKNNPRKGDGPFGAKAREDVLAGMAQPALLLQLPFLAYFAWYTSLRWVAAWFAGVVGVTGCTTSARSSAPTPRRWTSSRRA